MLSEEEEEVDNYKIDISTDCRPHDETTTSLPASPSPPPPLIQRNPSTEILYHIRSRARPRDDNRPRSSSTRPQPRRIITYEAENQFYADFLVSNRVEMDIGMHIRTYLVKCLSITANKFFIAGNYLEYVHNVIHSPAVKRIVTDHNGILGFKAYNDLITKDTYTGIIEIYVSIPTDKPISRGDGSDRVVRCSYFQSRTSSGQKYKLYFVPESYQAYYNHNEAKDCLAGLIDQQCLILHNFTDPAINCRMGYSFAMKENPLIDLRWSGHAQMERCIPRLVFDEKDPDEIIKKPFHV